MIDLLILGAHPVELTPLRGLLKSRVGGATTAMRTVGVGLVAAGVGAARAMHEVQARSALLIGSVGAYPGRVGDTGPLVIATETQLLDASALADRVQFPSAMATEQAFAPQLVASLARVLPTAYCEPVATTLAITTDDAVAKALATSESRFENLEAFAVAAAGQAYGLPTAALFGITNIVGSSGRDQWRTNHAEVAGRVARGVLRWLEDRENWGSVDGEGDGAPPEGSRSRSPEEGDSGDTRPEDYETAGGKQTIAVLGASRNRAKYGNKCVRAYQRAGWEVLPVNPHAETIEGLPAVAQLADLAGRTIDRLSVYLPPPITERSLGEMAALEISEVWLNPGSTTRQVTERARALGLKVVEGCSIVAIGASPSEFS